MMWYYYILRSITIWKVVKTRISASVDGKTAKAIEKILANGKFRNKSHVIESAIDLLKRHEEGQFVETLKELGGFK